MLVGLTLVVLFISFGIGAYFYLTNTVPDYEQDIITQGINRPVEIVRDEFGMPHIFAASEADAFFALGFCSAQDRLFQMDMIRRTVRGQMAEIAGKELVGVDKLFRTITAPRPVDDIYEQLPDSLRVLLRSYADGVNRYINDPETDLPFEFTLLGYQPSPWDPSDCLTTLYYMAWALNFSFHTELLRVQVADKVGAEMASEIFVDYAPDGPVSLPPLAGTENLNRLIETFCRARAITGCPTIGASNNWVVAGSKTASGQPLVANDMHLGLMIPGIWYEAHLHTPELNVSGVVLPGTPLIIAGASEYLAWGFTNFMADDADYYLEKINPENNNQYRFKDQWEDIITRKDSIAILGGEFEPLELKFTRHGVMIDSLIGWHDSTESRIGPLTMRWTAYDFGREAEAIYLLNHAHSVYDMKEAAALFKCPGQNWVGADRDGNIAWFPAVGIPRREGFDGRSVLPGWDGQHEWSGYLPFDELPQAINPERGWIATANNKPVDDDYPYYLSHCYAPSDRIRRISQMLEGSESITVDDLARMQSDNYLIMAADWMPRIRTALETAELSPTEHKALDKLLDWDYHTEIEKCQPTIFLVMLQFMFKETFEARLGDYLYPAFLSHNVFAAHKAIEALVEKGESIWFDNPTTENIETLNDVFLSSFRQAVALLESKLGDDIETWRWGKMHTLTLRHPVGQRIPVIGGWMESGPYEMPAATNCVNAMLYRLGQPFEVIAGPSQRHIFDLADINNSLRIIPTGISGHFMSDHYDDQTKLWSACKYRPFTLDREEIEQTAKYRMTIRPATDILDQPENVESN